MVEESKENALSNREDDFYSSDDESSNKVLVKTNKKSFDIYDKDDEEEEDSNDSQRDDEDDDEDEDDVRRSLQKKSTKTFIEKAQENEDSDNDFDDQYYGFFGNEEEEKENDKEGDKKKLAANSESEVKVEMPSKTQKNVSENSTSGVKKVKKLTQKQLENEEKRIKKTGVVYLSSLPPYMKPQKLRQVMSRFGEVGRIFLKPEDPKVYKSRIKSGGNKKKKFDEGWVEFASKSDAKLAANTLNGNVLGGKKRSFYHDDVMNVKYLKGFKWFDLTNALNREVEVRESKKQAELSQANKLNKAYIKNVETSKTINRVKESKKRKLPEGSKTGDNEIRRNFKQRNVATNRAGADSSIKNNESTSGLDNVLNKIF